MIYAKALAGYIKKSFKDKVEMATIKQIMEILPLDPQTSGVDLIVLGTKDVTNINKSMLQNAINSKHLDIQVLYLYTKNEDKSKLNNVIVKQIPKISADTIKDEINKVMQGMQTDKNKVEKVSLNKQDETIDDFDDGELFDDSEPLIDSGESEQNVKFDDTDLFAEEPIALTKEKVLFTEEIPTPNVSEEPVAELQQPDTDTTYQTLEDRILAMKDSMDWEVVKNSVTKDSIIRDIINKNSKYAGLLDTMEVLERNIRSVYINQHMSTEEKFNNIRDLGLQRTSIKGQQDDIIAEKVVEVINTICVVADETVMKKCNEINKQIDTIAKSKEGIVDEKLLHTLVRNRLELVIELRDMLIGLQQLYLQIDDTEKEILLSLDKDLPSSNDTINTMLIGMKGIFVPSNIPNIVNKLGLAIENGRVKFSMLETKINSIIQSVFKLCDIDMDIIKHLLETIDVLKAQKPENNVIIDNRLKTAAKMFIGKRESGITSTVLAYSAYLARTNNILVIDLTSNSKLQNYGVDVIELNYFLENKIEKNLTYVAGKVMDLDSMLSELQYRLSWYYNIIFILDENQTELANELSNVCLTCNIILNSTMSSILGAKEIVSKLDMDNIGRSIVVIDPVIGDDLEYFNKLNADKLIYRYIPIPSIPDMRKCTLRGIAPSTYLNILTIIGESFR